METYHATIREMPADERPRERLVRHGAEALGTAEPLAIILRVGSSRGSAVALGNQLLARFGSLKASARDRRGALGGRGRWHGKGGTDQGRL
jgi:DNA repair protein RadC